MLPLQGRVLDNRFRFITMLGEGGMSTVWMAENFRVRKRVAIKLMHPEFARNPRTLHRFQNEATAAGRIGNPHICDILDLGESPLGPYIVMEALSGQSFGELLETQPRIDPPLAVLIICEALKGLIAAHAVGIIHRDLKPENMFLHEPEPGRMLVKLMDFGISKFTEDPGGGRTGANVVMGTPEYMSPEQAAGAANVDARTDIWAMGVMLYRALTGTEPFKGNTMAALLLSLSMEEHTPIKNYLPQLPSGLIAVVDRCLAKEPQNRYATAQELYNALAPFQQLVAEGERPQAPVRTGNTMAIQLSQVPTIGTTAGGGTAGGPPTAGSEPGPTRQLNAAPGTSASTVASAPAGPMTFKTNSTTSPSGSQPLPPPDGTAQTWSSELAAPPAEPGQSWSMGVRSFTEAESRPYTPTSKRSERGAGWYIGIGVLGLGLLGLVGGGAFLAWNAGLFGGSGSGTTTATATETDSSNDEGGLAMAEAESGADAGATETDTGDETGAGTETGAETSGETGSTPAADTGADGDDDDDDGDGADDGGGGASDGGANDKPKPIEYGNLIRQGSIYTHKSRGPNGSWTNAKDYCSSLKRKKRHGLTKWRQPTVAELKSFGGTEVANLLYWSGESDGRKAKTVAVMGGTVSERELSNPAPRAFCVSRK
ncbi:serine/threonine protein kinase [Enhygromyxa salina]|uniref:Serine/threonine protein kinase n=1 Tax=Enhygromyxa salina TaxID=215803 RepID=A0A0C2CV11_9BACT|nr:serine/threonine protein kinase [Enhygromyxa salina]